MAICPECKTEFDPASQVIINSPHVKQVPRHVDAATCHVVEELRRIADQLEGGVFSGDSATPDGGVLLLFESGRRRLTVKPIGIRIGAQGLVDVLGAFESDVKRLALRESAGIPA